MATYVLTWNPAKWPWATLKQDIARFRKEGKLEDRWSTGVTRKIAPGDRVFLLKQGEHGQHGIMASGITTAGTHTDKHYSDQGREAIYTFVRFDMVLDPDEEELLSRQTLMTLVPLRNEWAPQASGSELAPSDAEAVERLWKEHLSKLGLR